MFLSFLFVILLSIVRSIEQFGIFLSSLSDIAVDRSIYLVFVILRRRFVILLSIDRSLYRSIGLFEFFCRRFVNIAVDRMILT